MLNYTGDSWRAVFDLPSILFMKSRLHGGRCNLGILFHKISIDLILNSPDLLLSDWSLFLHHLFKVQIHINQRRFSNINHSHPQFAYHKITAM